MGLDLEWAVLPEPVATARRQVQECGRSGKPCDHEPDCSRNYSQLIASCEFEYRRFHDIGETMLLHGMAYEAEPREPEPELPAGLTEKIEDADPVSRRIWDEAWSAWESQRVPGMAGIPLFKLRSNDRWLVTVGEIEEALAAYESVPQDEKLLLETYPKWVSWLEWLRVTRHHGGFIVA
jgi:hypothetical protein